jgi:hypothetical protein
MDRYHDDQTGRKRKHGPLSAGEVPERTERRRSSCCLSGPCGSWELIGTTGKTTRKSKPRRDLTPFYRVDSPVGLKTRERRSATPTLGVPSHLFPLARAKILHQKTALEGRPMPVVSAR